MDWLTDLITQHAQYAHYIIFCALILAGFNVPISEDLMLIISGVLASTVVPENTVQLFLGVFLGAYLSDWIAYWIGRKLGPKLWDIRWFASFVKKERLEQVGKYYEKHGIWTLIIGRFIPFGVRNCLFVTAGMGKMPFVKFIICDGIACLISNTTLFSLAYVLGKHYEILFEYLKVFNIIVFSAFAVAVLTAIWYYGFKKKSLAKTKDS